MRRQSLQRRLAIRLALVYVLAIQQRVNNELFRRWRR